VQWSDFANDYYRPNIGARHLPKENLLAALLVAIRGTALTEA
jgi:hypothetical protein